MPSFQKDHGIWPNLLLRVIPERAELIGHRHRQPACTPTSAPRYLVRPVCPRSSLRPYGASLLLRCAVPYGSLGERHVFSGGFTPAVTPFWARTWSQSFRSPAAARCSSIGLAIPRVEGERPTSLGPALAECAARGHRGRDREREGRRGGRPTCRARRGESCSPRRATVCTRRRLSARQWSSWALSRADARHRRRPRGGAGPRGSAAPCAGVPQPPLRTDPLTGLANRRAMQEALQLASRLAARHAVPLAALMIDIDRFKSINDRYGHDAGDLAICATSDVIRQTMRETDVCGRWGGEEFIVLGQHTDLDGARVVAEHVPARPSRPSLLPKPLHDHQLTVSIGVAVMHGGRHGAAAAATPTLRSTPPRPTAATAWSSRASRLCRPSPSDPRAADAPARESAARRDRPVDGTAVHERHDVVGHRRSRRGAEVAEREPVRPRRGGRPMRPRSLGSVVSGDDDADGDGRGRIGGGSSLAT